MARRDVYRVEQLFSIYQPVTPPPPHNYHNVFTWPTMIHPFRYDRHRYTLLSFSCICANRQCNEQSRVILVIRHVCLSIVDHHNQHYRASNHTRFYARSSNHVKTLPCTEYVTISLRSLTIRMINLRSSNLSDFESSQSVGSSCSKLLARVVIIFCLKRECYMIVMERLDNVMERLDGSPFGNNDNSYQVTTKARGT